MQFFTSEPITNNYNSKEKSEERKAVDAMTANRSTVKNSRGHKSSTAIEAMTTPSSADVIKQKRS